MASEGPMGPESAASRLAAPELYPLHDDDPGSVGPYQVAGRLGAGGGSVVYGAVDAQERCLAVKVLRPERAADEALRANLPQQVDKLRRVEAACAATVRAADPHARMPWVASDYVPGWNLQEHLLREGPLRGAALSAFAAGLAEALAAFHTVGLAHRDLKPTNAIVGANGPRLVDFGLDCAGRPPGEGWVFPEGYTEGAVAAPASDVFGWGCLVALAATGRHPFGYGSAEEVRARVLEGEPELEGLAQELRFSVTWSLAKDPDDRPRAATLVRTLLSSTDEDADAQATVPGTADQKPSARMRSLLRRDWVGIGGADHDPAAWLVLAHAETGPEGEEEPEAPPAEVGDSSPSDGVGSPPQSEGLAIPPPPYAAGVEVEAGEEAPPEPAAALAAKEPDAQETAELRREPAVAALSTGALAQQPSAPAPGAPSAEAASSAPAAASPGGALPRVEGNRGTLNVPTPPPAPPPVPADRDRAESGAAPAPPMPVAAVGAESASPSGAAARSRRRSPLLLVGAAAAAVVLLGAVAVAGFFLLGDGSDPGEAAAEGPTEAEVPPDGEQDSDTGGSEAGEQAGEAQSEDGPGAGAGSEGTDLGGSGEPWPPEVASAAQTGGHEAELRVRSELEPGCLREDGAHLRRSAVGSEAPVDCLDLPLRYGDSLLITGARTFSGANPGEVALSDFAILTPEGRITPDPEASTQEVDGASVVYELVFPGAPDRGLLVYAGGDYPQVAICYDIRSGYSEGLDGCAA